MHFFLVESGKRNYTGIEQEDKPVFSELSRDDLVHQF